MLVQNKKQLPEINTIPKLIALDTETLDKVNGIEGYSFAYVEERKIKSFFIPVAYEFSEEEAKKFVNVDSEFAFGYLSKLCANRRIIFHNAEFDLTVLEKNCGIKIDDDKFEDTMLLHWVLDTERKQGLKAIMKTEYGKEVVTYEEARTMGFEEFSKYADNDARFTLFLYSELMKEAKKHPKTYEGYKKYELPLVRVLQGINHTTNYIRVDEPLLKKYCDLCNKELEQIHKLLKSKLGDINFGSGKQLGEALEKVGYKIERKNPTAGMIEKARKKGEECIGNYSLDEKAINKLYKKHKGLIFDLLIYNRGVEKLNSTYVFPVYRDLKKIDSKVYVRTGYNFMHHGARSGRLSGDMQQMPRDVIVFKFAYMNLLKDLGVLKDSALYMDDDKFSDYCLLSKDFETLDEKEQEKYKSLVSKHNIVSKTLKFLKDHNFESCSIDIRKLYIAMPGKVLVDSDLSQIELRIIAHLSKDELMCGSFNRGEDLHKSSAENVSRVAGMKFLRQDIKQVNFGIPFGMYWTGLARKTGMQKSKAKLIWESYFLTYVGVKKFIDRTHLGARKSHYVQTLFGRRRNIDILGINDYADTRKAFMRRNNAENASVATVVSGSARDFLTVGTINFYRDYVKTGKCRIVLQVHDELLIECDEKNGEEIKNKAKEYMENGMKLIIPVTSEAAISKSWRGAHG